MKAGDVTEIMGVALTDNMGVRPTQLAALPFKIFYNHAFHKDFACEGGVLIVQISPIYQSRDSGNM